MPVLGRGFALLGEFFQLFGFPAGAAFLQDACQQLGAGFCGRVLRAPIGSELAFDCGFQQGLSVLRQFFLCGLQLGHPGIKVGKQFFELFNDTGLFGEWGKRYSKGLNIAKIDIFLRDTGALLTKLMSPKSNKMKEIA